MRSARLLLLAAATVAAGCGAQRTTVTVIRTVTAPPRPAAPEPKRVVAQPSLAPNAVANLFAPDDARGVGAWLARSAGGVPAQLLVEWVRARPPLEHRPHHLALWQRRRAEAEWRRIWRTTLPRASGYAVSAGDATGDGHTDFLVGVDFDGSGGCTRWFLLASVGGSLRRLAITHRAVCDTRYSVGRGHLRRDAGEYTAHDGHCCPTFSRETIFRWNGRRFVAERSRLFWNCIDRRCARWRRGPLRFTASKAAFWDDRGVAIGGRRPWLIARTTDGGRSWRIVDASGCPLGPPRVTGRGRAQIKLLHCGSFYDVRTRDYGKTWAARGA